MSNTCLFDNIIFKQGIRTHMPTRNKSYVRFLLFYPKELRPYHGQPLFSPDVLFRRDSTTVQGSCGSTCIGFGRYGNGLRMEPTWNIQTRGTYRAPRLRQSVRASNALPRVFTRYIVREIESAWNRDIMVS